MSTTFSERRGRPASNIGRKRLLVAPFGWHTRYMLRSYMRHTFLVVAAFLAIAITIDLSPRLPKVLAANPQAQGLDALLHVGWYTLLRVADILTRLLPITCFLGLAWSEIAHTRARERIVIWNSGRSPMQCLVPVLLFGLITGAVQLTLECYLRPAAVMTQIAARLGDFGERYDRSMSEWTHWLPAGNDVVSAQVDFEPAVLHHLTVYRFTPEGRLHQIITAESAAPTAQANQWRLNGGHGWDFAIPSGAETQGVWSEGKLRSEIELEIKPLWLTHLGIHAKYLYQADLLALARAEDRNYPDVQYRTWMHLRYAQATLPGAMALLGVTLSIFFLTYGARLKALLGIGLVGYAAHLMVKLFVFLGENGQIWPAFAAWFVPVLLICVSLVLLWLTGRKNLRSARENA
jgi:lipopolysaccharide export LptBFGC system permease protein LptF